MSVVFTKTLPDAEVPLAIGESMRLEFGQLLLDISHNPFEWILRYSYRHKQADEHEAEHGPETVLRYVFDNRNKQSQLRPCLPTVQWCPDRSHRSV